MLQLPKLMHLEPAPHSKSSPCGEKAMRTTAKEQPRCLQQSKALAARDLAGPKSSKQNKHQKGKRVSAINNLKKRMNLIKKNANHMPNKKFLNYVKIKNFCSTKEIMDKVMGQITE